MTFLDWDQVVRLAEAHNERFRTLIYVAVDTGMRWSELVGLRRSQGRRPPTEDPRHRAARPTRRRVIRSARAQDRRRRALGHDLVTDRRTASARENCSGVS